VAVAADDKEMFLRIAVRPEDQGVQMFLWRDSSEKDMKTMQLTSVMFGARCSPANAHFVRNKVADSHEKTYPSEALNAVKTKFYMDDYLNAMDTTCEANKWALQVRSILAGRRATREDTRNLLGPETRHLHTTATRSTHLSGPPRESC
jgi:hypothetical protein